MRAGPLRHRCALMQAQQVKRPGGGFTESWVEITKVWAEITIPTGRIAPVADQLEAVVSAEIRIRFRRDAVAGLRLAEIVKGVVIRTFQIEAALPDNDTTMLRLLGSSVVNP